MTWEHLVEEATKKAGLVWLDLPGTGPRPAWHVWHEDAAYVVTGGLEQPLPGLLELSQVVVTVPSKDNRSRIVSWRADCVRLAPGSDDWNAVVPVLVAGRLNLPDGQAAPDRWSRESAVVRLVPTGEVLDWPGRAPLGSGAAPPPLTPATTVGRLPGMLGRRRRRRRPSSP